MDVTLWGDVMRAATIGFTALFSAEALLKLTAYGLSYFKSSWNCFDLICVIASILDQTLDLAGIATFFRVLRVLRVVKIARGLVRIRHAHHLMVLGVYCMACAVHLTP
jgi:hypothetical protein